MANQKQGKRSGGAERGKPSKKGGQPPYRVPKRKAKELEPKESSTGGEPEDMGDK